MRALLSFSERRAGDLLFAMIGKAAMTAIESSKFRLHSG
jgi:hypothetical protein